MADFASLKQQVVVPSRARFWFLSCATVFVSFAAGLMSSATIAQHDDAAGEAMMAAIGEAVESELYPTPESCRLPSMRSTLLASVVREWAAPDSTAMLASARIVPAMEDGNVVGFKLYALRQDSPLALLGFRNGDTVHRVAGVELTSVDQVLALYTQLIESPPSEIRVELARERCALTLFLTLV